MIELPKTRESPPACDNPAAMPSQSKIVFYTRLVLSGAGLGLRRAKPVAEAGGELPRNAVVSKDAPAPSLQALRTFDSGPAGRLSMGMGEIFSPLVLSVLLGTG